MCLAMPLEIVETLTDNNAVAEVNGVRRKVNLTLVPDAKVGDFVMVHAGFAIEIVEHDEALETLDAFRELAEALKDC